MLNEVRFTNYADGRCLLCTFLLLIRPEAHPAGMLPAFVSSSIVYEYLSISFVTFTFQILYCISIYYF